MSAKYTRVPSLDPELGHDVSLDFSSSFTYSNPAASTRKYQSIFTYGDSKYQMDNQSVSVGKKLKYIHVPLLLLKRLSLQL